MNAYEQVCAILTAKGWPANTAPAPEATAVALSTQTPDQVAEVLDAWVNDVADSSELPPGITGWYAFRRWVIHRTFAIGREMWEYGTAIALGQIVEPPLDKIAEAKSSDEWLRNHSDRRNRLGFLLLDHTPDGDAELARRQAAALDVPRPWAKAGKADIWVLAVVEGMIPVPRDAFSAAYAVKTPSLDSVRFLDADQWLANLRADDKRKPRPWNDDGSRNPEWKD